MKRGSNHVGEASSRFCVVCDEVEIDGVGMCPRCQRSYDQALKRDDGTLMSVIEWSAIRSRTAERRRQTRSKRCRESKAM